MKMMFKTNVCLMMVMGLVTAGMAVATPSTFQQVQAIAAIKNAAIQSNELTNFLPTNAGKPLGSDVQVVLFGALQNIFAKTPQSTQGMASVATLLTNWLNSNLLTAAQNTTLKEWIARLNSTLVPLQIEQRGGALHGMRDIGRLIAELSQMLIDSTGKKLSGTLQNNVIGGLQKIFSARQKDVASLLSMQALLTNWLNSNLLTSAQNTMISSQWLPTIAMALQSSGVVSPVSSNATSVATPVQSNQPVRTEQAIVNNNINTLDGGIIYGITNAQRLQDHAAQLDALTVIFNSLAIQNVSMQVTVAYVQAVQTVITGINVKDSGVQKRAYDLLQAMLASTFLAESQKQLIKRTLPAKVGISPLNAPVPGALLVGVPVNQNIVMAMQQQNVSHQINSLIVIAKSIGLQAGVGSVQNAIAKALQQLTSNASKLNADQLKAFSNLVTLVLVGNLLTPDQKNYINATMLPSIGLGGSAIMTNVLQVVNPALPMLQMIDVIMQSTDQSTKIDALKFVFASLNGCSLDKAAINTFASAIQRVFTSTDLQDVALKQKLSSLLAQTQGGSVLTPVQQNYVATKLIGQLAQAPLSPSDKNIAAVVAMTDSLQQLNALQQLVAGGKGQKVSAASQRSLVNLLNDLSAKVQSLGAAVLSTFIQVLGEMKTSTMLNAEQQNTVATTLLPMAQEALQASKK